MEKGEALNFVQKREIVQRLARFDTPTEVQKAFKADHGVELSLPRILFYDPTSKAGAALSEELKVLFRETREAFLKDIDAIPIANKAVQLLALSKSLTLAQSRGQIPLVIDLVEAAAKIAGTVVAKHELKAGVAIGNTGNATDGVFRIEFVDPQPAKPAE